MLKKKAFDDIERIVTHDNLLMHTDFKKRFDIHMDARKFQIGAVIIQDGKPISFYIHKLTNLQKRYTLTEN